MGNFFFDGWEGLGRILLVGPLAYVALVLFLRVTGKRALSKLNSFDLVVTVALGSSLATTFLSEDVSLTEGALTFGLLLALQFLVTWLSVRSEAVRAAAKSEPALLVRRGRFLREAMRRERVTEEEVLQVIRASPTSGDVDVVLETDGSMSVVGADRDAVLRDVRGARETVSIEP
ncbi:MAG: DUF421 domain-containing protein [Myxococcota bacterium]